VASFDAAIHFQDASTTCTAVSFPDLPNVPELRSKVSSVLYVNEVMVRLVCTCHTVEHIGNLFICDDSALESDWSCKANRGTRSLFDFIIGSERDFSHLEKTRELRFIHCTISSDQHQDHIASRSVEKAFQGSFRLEITS